MKRNVNSYLEYLDIVIDCIPKKEMVCLEEILKTSYSLLQSSDILLDICYLDYLFCYIFYKKYISYQMFLELGKYLKEMIHGLKITS